MSIALPLDKMTVEEKIQTTETHWNDLCGQANNFASPGWHREVLTSREAAVENGEDTFVDWEAAKRDIRNTVK